MGHKSINIKEGKSSELKRVNEGEMMMILLTQLALN